ncbi:MAG: hypothetical protein K2X81_09980 [Candidatus Obscuribacterales bacterium]|nr:hypothetical protein [Candidatus Obscuribacterales bacterium]
MSIMIGKHEFEGPYKSIDALKESKGIYALLSHEGTEYELIHVAQADNIKEQIELSRSATISKVMIAACYTPFSGLRERSRMIEEINFEFDGHDDQEYDSQLVAQTA